MTVTASAIEPSDVFGDVLSGVLQEVPAGRGSGVHRVKRTVLTKR